MPNAHRPNNTVETIAAGAGARVQCLWQMRGDRHSGVAWIECLMIGNRGDKVIVTTYAHGGWDAFTAPHSNRVDDTIADVLNRCGVKAPRTVPAAPTPSAGFEGAAHAQG